MAQNRILRTNFPSKSTFLPFLWFFFFLITSMSSNLSVSISISWHVFKFTMPWKAISPYEKRIMNDIQDGEASSVADRSRKHVEPVLPVRNIAFWIEHTLVTTYLFSFPLRVRNNRFSLYILCVDLRETCHGAACIREQSLSFCSWNFRNHQYHQTSLSQARDRMGRKKWKGRNDHRIKREWLCMFQSGKHHAVCDCIYTRVPDVLVEIFAGS